MAERNAAVPEEQRIEFRMGINVGDIIIECDDIYGDGVNIATRLEALAEPGSICVSRTVITQTRDKHEFPFTEEHRAADSCLPYSRATHVGRS